MIHKIDGVNLNAWQSNLADCLDLINGLSFNFEKDFYWLTYDDRNRLQAAISDVYDAIGTAVENGLVERAKYLSKKPKREG